jgi:hypothetical protein
MGLFKELNRLNQYLDNGTYRAQYEYGNDELRKELLGTADLLFEVADKVEEILTELMVKKGFGMGGNGDDPAKEADDPLKE